MLHCHLCLRQIHPISHYSNHCIKWFFQNRWCRFSLIDQEICFDIVVIVRIYWYSWYGCIICIFLTNSVSTMKAMKPIHKGLQERHWFFVVISCWWSCYGSEGQFTVQFTVYVSNLGQKFLVLDFGKKKKS